VEAISTRGIRRRNCSPKYQNEAARRHWQALLVRDPAAIDKLCPDREETESAQSCTLLYWCLPSAMSQTAQKGISKSSQTQYSRAQNTGCSQRGKFKAARIGSRA
jgi:hypothetical protein